MKTVTHKEINVARGMVFSGALISSATVAITITLARADVIGFDAAVADIPDGATIAFGGFAQPGVPFNLIAALHRQGAG